ncbi:MAG: head-tail adaptor protein [Desulfurellales bacterium]|nr:MAG: head-tail adaptor protein [Desulfurellales bacterium]
MTCKPCKTEPRLNCVVVVQRIKSAATRDANNEIDLTSSGNWETYATRLASFKTRGGSERFASDMIQAGQTHRVYMRRDATTKSITPEMRLSYDSRYFNILAVADQDEMHEWMVIDCVEAK